MFTSPAAAMVLFLASLIKARPLDVPTSVCSTIFSGNLTTSDGRALQSTDGVLSFGGSLEVEFQSCQPNFGSYDGNNGTPVGGHLVVSSSGKCLTIPDSSSIPFSLQEADCEYVDDSRQTFSNFIRKDDGEILFVGGTHVDGTIVFWGDACTSGTFGVGSGAAGSVELVCVDDPGTSSLKL